MVNDDFLSLRSNCKAAVIQSGEQNIHAVEWWNGEGIDFMFESDTDKIKHIDLHIEEIEKLIVVAIAMCFVDISECNKKAKIMKKRSKKSDKTIKQLATRSL